MDPLGLLLYTIDIDVDQYIVYVYRTMDVLVDIQYHLKSIKHVYCVVVV